MAALYVVATPIGNLQDFSPRAVETMKTADLIIAEDTRVTMKLCQVFGFHAPLVSCHRHNEGNKAEPLASKILEGDLNAVLVTDAGTPCISDPGNEVVRACAAAGIQVIPVPGCCAGIAALSVSGADAREFTFYGFLPREKKDLREKLREISKGTRVAVVHESPFRITELTEAITETLPEAELTVCCDLTKIHEKTVYGKSADVLAVLKAGESLLAMDVDRACVVCHGGAIVSLMEAWFPDIHRHFYQWQPGACGGYKITVQNGRPVKFQEV